MAEIEAGLWDGVAVDDEPAIESTPSLPQADGPKGVHDGIIFDIETGPLPEAEIWKVVTPFDPSTLKEFPTFDPAAVKIGNLKDAAKIADKIEACRAQHATDAAEHNAKNATAEADYKAKVIKDAALSALTGRVLAIGYYFTDDEDSGIDMIGSGVLDEGMVIQSFWNYYEAADEHTRFIGHNIHGFDLPFLIQRSWLLGIDVPRGVMKGRFFAEKFVDTMAVWACGKMGGNSFVGLDVLARALGVGSKNGSGAMFAELLEKDPAAAREYLANDIAITYAVAKRLRLCK